MWNSTFKWRWSLLGAVIALCILAAAPHTARASTIVVNSNADNMADDGACTLREAIESANTDTNVNGDCGAGGSGVDTITFATGLNGTPITLNGASLTPDSDMVITGNGQAETIIEASSCDPLGGLFTGGNCAHTNRVFTLQGSDDVTIENLTVRHGQASTGGAMYIAGSGPFTLSNVDILLSVSDKGGGIYAFQSNPDLDNVYFYATIAEGAGGGMYNIGSSPTLTNVTFESVGAQDLDAIFPTGSFNGGGMYNVNSSSPTLDNVTFSQTSADGDGGGMYNANGSNPSLYEVVFDQSIAVSDGAGMFNNDSSPELILVTFQNGQALNGSGAGMFNFNNSAPTLADVTFSGNDAEVDGGGMYNDGSSPTLDFVTFSGNNALTGSGAGIANVSGGSLDLTSVMFDLNISAGFGGGIFNDGGTVSIADSGFLGNDAANGGGIATQGGSLFIVDALFSGNSATGGGGLYAQTGNYNLINLTFVGNSASYGGGVYNANQTNFNVSSTIRNSLFWNNSASTYGPEMYNVNSSTTAAADINVSYTLIDAAGVIEADDVINNGGLTSWTSGGTGNITDGSDPLLADADGPDNTFGTLDDDPRLTFGSPAIDVGDNNLNNGTDADGQPRVVDGDDNGTTIIDLGAFEYAPPTYYVDVDATGDNDGSSWNDAFVTLHDALSIATPGSQIWVAEGVYYPDEGGGQTDDDRFSSFVLPASVGIYGGFDGTEYERNQRDPFAHITVLSGDLDQNDTPDADGIVWDTDTITGDNALNVVISNSIGSKTVLDGFTITAGLANASYVNTSGAGLRNINASPTLNDVRFIGNKAAGINCQGGGMSNSDTGSPTLNRVEFIANQAACDSSGGGGGGMHNGFGTESVIIDTIFIGNQTTRGGGGLTAGGADITLNNALFIGNTAGIYGGAALIASGTSTLTNVTLVGNHADQGGGFWSTGGTFTFTNNIVWGNTADTAYANMYAVGATMPVSYSLLQGSGGSGVNWDSQYGTDNGNNLDTDPLFVDADGVDNVFGTLDDNARLQGCSPAVDAGDDAAVPVGVTTDLDGNPRFDGTVDMGAYERVGGVDCSLNAPSGLMASASLTVLEVDLGWTDNAGNEDNFTVERRENGSPTWTVLTSTLPADTISYNDTTVACETTYDYRVKATNAGTESDYSNIDAATTGVCPPDDAPSGLTASASLTVLEVDLSWTDNATNEEAHVIERSADGGSNWIEVDSVASGTNTYTDTGVACDTTYDYRVKATNAGGDSAYSNTDSATTIGCAPDAPPRNLVATFNPATLDVDLTWDDNSSNEDGFTIERSDDGGTTWFPAIPVSANTTSTTDTTGLCGGSYDYRVVATNTGGSTAPSNTDGANITCPVDGSFEEAFSFWTTSAKAQRYGTGLAHDGGYVMLLQNPGSLDFARQTFDRLGLNGDTVTLTFYVAGQNVPTTGHIGGRVELLSGGGVIDTGSCLYTGLRGSFNWKMVTCNVTASAVYDQIRVTVGAQNVNGGSIGFDSVSVTQTFTVSPD